MLDSIIAWLGEHQLVAQLLAAALLLILAYLADRATKWVLLRAVRRVVRGTAFTWDDVLLKHGLEEGMADFAQVVEFLGLAGVAALAAEFDDVVEEMDEAFFDAVFFGLETGFS